MLTYLKIILFLTLLHSAVIVLANGVVIQLTGLGLKSVLITCFISLSSYVVTTACHL